MGGDQVFSGKNLVRLCFSFLGASTCCRPAWGGMPLRKCQSLTLAELSPEACEMGVARRALPLFLSSQDTARYCQTAGAPVPDLAFSPAARPCVRTFAATEYPTICCHTPLATMRARTKKTKPDQIIPWRIESPETFEQTGSSGDGGCRSWELCPGISEVGSPRWELGPRGLGCESIGTRASGDRSDGDRSRAANWPFEMTPWSRGGV
jgi:hypothetical protein